MALALTRRRGAVSTAGAAASPARQDGPARTNVAGETPRNDGATLPLSPNRARHERRRHHQTDTGKSWDEWFTLLDAWGEPPYEQPH